MHLKKIFKVVLVITVLLVLASAIFYSLQEPYYAPTAMVGPNQKFLLPRFIANKAKLQNSMLGNNLESILATLKAPGVEGIELDVRLSKDKVPFIFHADTLEALTNGHGIPEEKTWAELKDLVYKQAETNPTALLRELNNAEDMLDEAKPNQAKSSRQINVRAKKEQQDNNEQQGKQKNRVSTADQIANATANKIVPLEQVLNLVASDKYLFLNIKDKNILNKGFADALANLIEKYDVQESVVVESLNPLVLGYLRIRARDIIIMYNFIQENKAQKNAEKQLEAVKTPWLFKFGYVQKQVRRLLRPDLLGPHWNVEKNLLQTLLKQGYPLIAWTVDDVAEAEQLFALGVTGIQSNESINIIKALNDAKPQWMSDAGGSKAQAKMKVYVTKTKDVVDALRYAQKQNLAVSISGGKQSTGGQSILANSLHLDMLGFNKVSYNKTTKRIRAQAGATWKKIQRVLDQNDRAITVAQPGNIFTVGGSVSANAHGWQVGLPPIAATIESLKILTSEGKMVRASRQENPELFKSIIGGYGLFGVILEVVLNTSPNSLLKLNSVYMPMHSFEKEFRKKISKNPNVELAYARLSVDKDHLLKNVALFWYEKSADQESIDKDLSLAKDREATELRKERLVTFKKAILRASEYSELDKKMRWLAEKAYAKANENVFSRNTAMSPDIHMQWPIRRGYQDVLQEYFIPKGNADAFIDILKKKIVQDKMNLLNVTIREVRSDETSTLPYAKEDVFSFVLLFSEKEDAEGIAKMKNFTQGMVGEVLNLGGSFYLAYRLDYTLPQLAKAYPMIHQWLKLKNKWDPKGMFSSQFYEYIKNVEKS